MGSTMWEARSGSWKIAFSAVATDGCRSGARPCSGSGRSGGSCCSRCRAGCGGPWRTRSTWGRARSSPVDPARHERRGLVVEALAEARAHDGVADVQGHAGGEVAARGPHVHELGREVGVGRDERSTASPRGGPSPRCPRRGAASRTRARRCARARGRRSVAAQDLGAADLVHAPPGHEAVLRGEVAADGGHGSLGSKR